MNIFNEACKKKPNHFVRVHPLLLSLSETIHASETNPDINAISENDERALRSNYYTPPDSLPPLKIHFSGQNGPSLLPKQNDYALTSVAGCRACVEFGPQADLEEEGNDAQGDFSAASHDLKNSLAHIGCVSQSGRNKGKKRRRASTGSVQGNLPNVRGPKAARVIRKPKGIRAQKAGSSDANPSHPEETPDKSSREGEVREAGPRMFAACLFSTLPMTYVVL
jgi:hypothetical protein